MLTMIAANIEKQKGQNPSEHLNMMTGKILFSRNMNVMPGVVQES